MTNPIPTPVPAGPSLRLELSDPPTWVAILSIIGAVAVKAVPAIAGWSIAPYYPAAAVIAAAIVVAVTIAAKHTRAGHYDIAGALSELAGALQTALPLLPAAAQTKVTEVVDDLAPLAAKSGLPAEVRLWLKEIEAWVDGGEKGPFPPFPPAPPLPPIGPPPVVGPPVPVPTPTLAPPLPASVHTISWFNLAPNLPNQDATRIVEALNIQAPHVSARWGQQASVTHVLGSDPALPLADGVWASYFIPTAATAGVLGFHSLDLQGRPYSKVEVDVILSNGGTLLSGVASVSSVASHEACEIAVDPDVDLTATAPNGDVWALEDADPVESNFYDVTLADGTQVSVSDFVYPAFFGQGTGLLDKTGAVSAPFTLAPGGYAVVNGSQIFGENYPEWRKILKLSPASRTYRRLSH